MKYALVPLVFRRLLLMAIDARTRLVGLLGWPVEHSLSPLIHNTAFAVQGLNYRYVALPVRPEHAAEAVGALKVLGFVGANVTIPHKQAVMPFVDELSPRAATVRAVNTLVVRRQGDGAVSVYGDNTDVAGFLATLAPYAGLVAGAPMVIFGAGGAARAVAYALLTSFQPQRLTFVARHVGRAQALVGDLQPFDTSGVQHVVAPNAAADAVRSSGLVVNATPVGMHPNVGDTPWPAADDFGDRQIVYDLVYNPFETRLLREARARGARAIGGLEMLVAQAGASYEQWTHRALPADAVRQALTASLG